MFQLVVALLSISLVAILATAGVFYGGEAFSEMTLAAEANVTMAAAQQINAANVLCKRDQNGICGSHFIPHYLRAIPHLPKGSGIQLFKIDRAHKIIYAKINRNAHTERVGNRVINHLCAKMASLFGTARNKITYDSVQRNGLLSALERVVWTTGLNIDLPPSGCVQTGNINNYQFYFVYRLS